MSDGRTGIDLSADFFALFGLPQQFSLDAGLLEARFHGLLAEVHPDRAVQLGESGRRLAMQWATRVNEGYRTLRRPLSRALYLLSQRGVDAALEQNTAMSPEFLMEQMRWREAVDEATEAGDDAALEDMSRQLKASVVAVESGLREAFDVTHDLDGARELVRQLHFISKLDQQVSDLLAEREEA